MTQELKIPKIGEYVRGQGTLVAIEIIPPDPPTPIQDFIFEEITARVEIRLGKEMIKKVAEYWDYSGKESSVEGAIEAAKDCATKRNINPQSDLKIVAIKVSDQVRTRLSKQGNPYQPEFKLFKPPEYGSKRGLPDPVETIVWSSRWEPTTSS